MKSPWPTKKLGEIVEKLELKKPPINSWPYIEIGDIDIENKSIVFKDKKSVNGAIIAPADSVLVSRVRPSRGAIVYLDKDYVVSSAFSVIKPKLTESFSKFLFYWLGFSKDFIRYLQGKQKGSNYPSVREKDILNYEILLPPLPIQQKIVERLDAIKKAQELNNKQIELTEELFQSLLHRELDPKGENWEVKRLGDIGVFKRGPFGGSLKKEIFVESGYKVYEQKNVIYNDFTLGNYFIDEKKYKEMIDFAINSGDLIISCSGTIGKVVKVPEKVQPGIINQALLKITPIKKYIINDFLKFLLETSLIQERLTANTRGSAIRNVASVVEIKRIKIPLPPLETQQKIIKKLSAVQEYKKKLLEQKQKLQELFESVLNKSFSRILEYR